MNFIFFVNEEGGNGAFGLETARKWKNQISEIRSELKVDSCRQGIGSEFEQRETNDYIFVISKHTRFFSSGGDLKQQKNLNVEELKTYHAEIRNILQEFDDLPLTKIALVDGLTVGGGMEILSCCDHVCASPGALFGLWQGRVGLSFGWGGGQRLRRRSSSEVLLKCLSDGATYDVWSAKSLGWVDCVMPRNQIREFQNQIAAVRITDRDLFFSKFLKVNQTKPLIRVPSKMTGVFLDSLEAEVEYFERKLSARNSARK